MSRHFRQKFCCRCLDWLDPRELAGPGFSTQLLLPALHCAVALDGYPHGLQQLLGLCVQQDRVPASSCIFGWRSGVTWKAELWDILHQKKVTSDSLAKLSFICTSWSPLPSAASRLSSGIVYPFGFCRHQNEILESWIRGRNDIKNIPSNLRWREESSNRPVR